MEKNICISYDMSNDMSHYRGFIAIPIPINETIETIHQELSTLSCDIKLVALKNLHITVKFLGDTKEDDNDQIIQFIQQAVRDIDSFSIQLKGTGVFPNRNYLKAIWIGIHQAESISTIAASLNTNLTTLGFTKEKRGFKPHLTIGRVKTARGKEQLLQTIDHYQDTVFAEIPVDSVLLMKSTLTPQGPIYTIKETIQL